MSFRKTWNCFRYAGGEIIRGFHGKLLQSSAVAEMIEASFALEHKKMIPWILI